MLGGRDLRLLRPRDTEALLDEEAFEHEEFLPYWAELWPSSLALARTIAGRALRGARTLELGCGLGLPSIAAALAGGRVLATDWSPEAIAMTARQRRAQRARARDAACARGPSPRRCSSARRGTSCSPPTCSTSARNAERCSRCSRACGPARSLARRPRPRAGRRFLEARGRDVRDRRRPARRSSRTAPCTGCVASPCVISRLPRTARGCSGRRGGGGGAGRRRRTASCRPRAARGPCRRGRPRHAADHVEQTSPVVVLALAPTTSAPPDHSRTRSAAGERADAAGRGASPCARSPSLRTNRRGRRGGRVHSSSPARRAPGRSAPPSRRSAAPARARAGSGTDATARPRGRVPSASARARAAARGPGRRARSLTHPLCVSTTFQSIAHRSAGFAPAPHAWVGSTAVLAYVFWHRPAGDADPAAYEARLTSLPRRAGGASARGLLPLPRRCGCRDAPWLPGDGPRLRGLVRRRGLGGARTRSTTQPCGARGHQPHDAVAAEAPRGRGRRLRARRRPAGARRPRARAGWPSPPDADRRAFHAALDGARALGLDAPDGARTRRPSRHPLERARSPALPEPWALAAATAVIFFFFFLAALARSTPPRWPATRRPRARAERHGRRARGAGAARGARARLGLEPTCTARPRRPARPPGPPGRGGAARRAVGPDRDAARRRAAAALPQRPRRRRRPRHGAVAARAVVAARSRTACCTAAARST